MPLKYSLYIQYERLQILYKYKIHIVQNIEKSWEKYYVYLFIFKRIFIKREDFKFSIYINKGSKFRFFNKHL